ncbi:hypothetical protein ACTXMZ_17015 [Brachybacterium alimentarium]|uniref:hypothetical protein n=1 Tax=Brachybacterium alimentarium TaxID=47845 RepID=UPI003FD113FB
MIRMGRKHAGVAMIAAVVTLGLAACGGGVSETSSGGAANEWSGVFTVANGDSSFYVGELFRHDTVTVKCTEKGGTISAVISESRTGNKFVTTQPDEGSGLAGGTLTLGEGGEEFTWAVRDGATAEEENPFEGEMQSGEPVAWTDTGMLEFGSGLRQATTNGDEGEVRVQIPGQVDCSGGSEG